MTLVNDDLILGLDIGTTKVCAVVGERNEEGRLNLLGIGSAPTQAGMRKGVVINIESTMQSVQQAIDKAEMMSGREVSEVYTGIAGAHIEGINSRGVVPVTGRGREIDQQDVDRVIDAAKAIVIPMDREVLHVLPREFIVDDQGGVRDPLDMIGIRLEAEVHIVTCSVTSAQNLLKCINRAGYRVQDIVLESLAASGVVLSPDEKELGVLLIDLGGGTTDVLVFLDGAPYHTGVVPLGGEQVTSDLSIMLKTPREAAERLKKESGCCFSSMVDSLEEVIIPGVGSWPSASIPRQKICGIIQPRMEEIFGLVREQLSRKDYLKHLTGGIVITGGGSLLPGAQELAMNIFNLPARIGLPIVEGAPNEEFLSPQAATAVGLAAYGLAEKEEYNRGRGMRGKEGSAGRSKGGGFFKWIKEFF
ncbi:MAG: cell division protein FtsA [Spirochaetales bacterium]|jgi:cell division protein FtsA|nr:cell division protein FtsA [Spirochaetales bacterium]